MKKCFSLFLTCVLILCSMSMSVNAAFEDVPETHWAQPYIEALANGGLVEGYGGDVFGPDDLLNIDHLATLICNAKGYPSGTKNGYWGYEAVEYCVNTLRCVPNLGEISSKNYSVPCPRELAIYMVTKALGASGTTTQNWELTSKDIPDYADIDYQYASTILYAYQLGLVEGVDKNRTFLPKKTLNRAEMCTLLYRAGYTTAAERPDDEAATGMTGEEIYEEIQNWCEWREFTGNWDNGGYSKTLTTTDPKYGGIKVILNRDGGFGLLMYEENPDSSSFTNNDGWVDAYGNPITDEAIIKNGWCDENGKFVRSSGWSYEARQLVKRILELAYPNEYEETYAAIISVMKQEIYEIPSRKYSSALRWVDGRCYDVSMDQSSRSIAVGIGAPENKSVYASYMEGAGVAKHLTYNPKNGSYEDIPAMFELGRG